MTRTARFLSTSSAFGFLFLAGFVAVPSANAACPDPWDNAGCENICTTSAGTLTCDLAAYSLLGPAQVFAISYYDDPGQLYHEYEIFGSVYLDDADPSVADQFCCPIDNSGGAVDVIYFVGTDEGDNFSLHFEDDDSSYELQHAYQAVDVVLDAGPGNDYIRGSDHANMSYTETLNGEMGSDTIHARGGEDVVNGGPGDDTITGGPCSDIIDGGPDSDTIDGGNERDENLQEVTGDTITGGEGADYIAGGQGHDNINGGGGGDVICGDSGDDVLNDGDATPGVDLLWGGEETDSDTCTCGSESGIRNTYCTEGGNSYCNESVYLYSRPAACPGSGN